MQRHSLFAGTPAEDCVSNVSVSVADDWLLKCFLSAASAKGPVIT